MTDNISTILAICSIAPVITNMIFFSNKKFIAGILIWTVFIIASIINITNYGLSQGEAIDNSIATAVFITVIMQALAIIAAFIVNEGNSNAFEEEMQQFKKQFKKRS